MKLRTILQHGAGLFCLVLFSQTLFAQQPGINYFRSWNQEGVNVFETTKDDVEPYEGVKVRVGGNFTQQFQSLSHSNNADVNLAEYRGNEVDLNALYPIAPGFNLATANLNLDVQLGDGIRLSLENYMSSRHHPEFWVKGGYIQFDKLPMFGSPDWFSKFVTLKVGHMEVNYGDQHFRRSDNGNTVFNPFVGNTIMDAFTTEIGGEAYLKLPAGVIGMVGMTSGLINGDIQDRGEDVTRNPSIYGKLGIDRNINDDLRVRLTGSIYMNSGTTRNTLFAGDRTGSRFYLAMEPEYYRNFRAGGAVEASSATNRFTSGRISPNFTHQVTTFMINPFIKWKGLEFFGTYELASGKEGADADERSFGQFSAELTYRFLKNEQLFVAGRYNQASGNLGFEEDVSIDRIEVAAGWYVTQNLLFKAGYIQQTYNDFPMSDYRSEGEFNGIVIEAAVGF
jgi:hypothetical protein